MSTTLAVLLGFLSFSSAVDAEQLKRSEMLIQGALDSRQRLMSGVCRITGTNKFSQESDTGQMTVTEESVDCFCAFDFEKGLYRFDRSAPPQGGITRGGKFIRTLSHTYEMLQVDREQAVMRNRSDADPNPTIAPFDIRCVGLFNLVGPCWTLTPDDYLHPENKKTRLVELSKESKDVYRLTWETTEVVGFTKRSLWIDAAKGYTWIRHEWAYVSEKDSTKIVIETSWDEIGGGWVPISLRLTDDQFGNHTEADWAIDWESVNESVAAENFKPENLAPGKELGLYDDSLGEPVFLRTIGVEQSVLKSESELAENPTKWPRILLVIVGVVLLPVVAIIALLRRRRLRQA